MRKRVFKNPLLFFKNPLLRVFAGEVDTGSFLNTLILGGWRGRRDRSGLRIRLAQLMLWRMP